MAANTRFHLTPLRQKLVIYLIAGLTILISLIDTFGFEVTAQVPAVVFFLLNALAIRVGRQFFRMLSLLSLSHQKGVTKHSSSSLSGEVDCVIGVSLTTLAAIVVVEEILGSLGVLGTRGLMLAFGLLAIFLETISLKEYKINHDHFFVSKVDNTRFLSISAGLILAEVAQVLYAKWLTPPLDDALGYHLPFAVEWIQKGNLSMPIPPAGDPSTPFYPFNASLWMFWLILPFRSDIWARFVQVPFAWLLFLGIIQISREVKSGERPSLMASILAISLPELIRNIFVVGNDVIVSAFLVIATAQALSLWRNFDPLKIFIGSISLGLALGTKVLALPYVGILVLVYILAIIKNWQRHGLHLRKLFLFGVILLILGGYSYVRNAAVMGNPFYPVQLQLGEYRIFPGLYVVTSEWKRFHPHYPFNWQAFLVNSPNSLGLTMPLWILPGLVLSIWLVFTQPNSAVLILLLLVTLGIGVFWFILPYHAIRYLFFVICWATVVGTWGWETLFKRQTRLLQVVVLILVGFNVINIPMHTNAYSSPLYWLGVLIALGLGIGVFQIIQQFGLQYNRFAVNKKLALAILLLGIGLIHIGGTAYGQIYESSRFLKWRGYSRFLGTQPEAWEWLYEATKEHPALIAVSGTNIVYPLYGHNLNNKIIYIGTDGSLPQYDWGRPFHVPGTANLSKWLNRLREEGIQLLYITPHVVIGGWPIEDQWAADNPELFELSFGNEQVHIWRIRSVFWRDAQTDRVQTSDREQHLQK